MSQFDDATLLRYSRHIMLPQIDIEGQSRLMEAKVAIIGLGGLGSPVAMYLASSGIGQLTLVDFDRVELSNLQRQIIHDTNDIDTLKVTSAAQTCQRLNPNIVLDTLAEDLDLEQLIQVASEHDVIVDCTDNFTIRQRINLASIKAKTPLVSGAAIAFQGQISVFNTDAEAPCYRCLYTDDTDEPDTRCSESGVIAPMVGLIGSWQALEVCKLLLGKGQTLSGKLVLIDALHADMRTITLTKDPACPVCQATHSE